MFLWSFLSITQELLSKFSLSFLSIFSVISFCVSPIYFLFIFFNPLLKSIYRFISKPKQAIAKQ